MKNLYIILFLLLSSISYSQSPCPGLDSLNYGSQWYHTVQIGSQCWLKENLNIGMMKPAVKDQINNDTIEKFCYNNDPAMCDIYGGLYEWREAMLYSGKTIENKGICPLGWHIPSRSEFDTLISAVSENGNSLKQVGQGDGTNTSGYSALLSGKFLTYPSILFNNIGSSAEYWSSDYFIYPYTFNTYPYSIEINSNNSVSIGQSLTSRAEYGNGVRCIRDSAGLFLQSPYGNKAWSVGSIHDISWNGSNVINVKLEYTIDNGTSWTTIINSTPFINGNYKWTIPNTPSKNCKVKISDVDNPLTTSSSDNIFTILKSCPGGSSIVHGGKIYHTVVIGNKCWFKENLDIGAFITSSQTPSVNGTIEKYCYNDDTANCTLYGGLYTVRELSEPGICPAGWYTGDIPKNEVIFDGNSLKEIGQGSGFGTGTNTSGFSALLAGYFNGTFTGLGHLAAFTEAYQSPRSASFLFDTTSNIAETEAFGGSGGSLRCINDNLDISLTVELNSFIVSITDNNINLNWSTATETNTSSFEVEKKTLNNNTWQNIASIKASGNSTTPKQYSYTDKNVNFGKYSYRLKMLDLDGSFKYSNILNVEITPPAKFELSNAYPNPWNPTTTIRYQVPINTLVTIKLYDALGRGVSTLVNEEKPAGNYEVTLNNKNLSSGVYYYQMKAGNFIETKKVTLLK